MEGRYNAAYSSDNVSVDIGAADDGHKKNGMSSSSGDVIGSGGGKGPGKGSVLSAHNIDYTVQVSTKCCATADKQILHNVTGIFKPGMSAIMGPTGSGKSSFLDVLAGRVDQNLVKGHLLLDGHPVPENFKCMVGYVVQDDVVMGTLTVRENFAFSAALRLPNTVKSPERKDRVNQVIKELGLQRCADTKVGNEFIRGVSGGERKRCNIGMELIISPPVLYLDEPTTGLDANTANTVLLFLRRLSRRGRTVIFSIHQPRYSIYRLFDNLMLLSDGHTVFHGPAKEALTFFRDQGFICHEHNNPPDFFLDVINGDPSVIRAEAVEEDDLAEMEAEGQHEKLVEAFNKSTWNSNLHAEANQIFAGYQSRGGKNGEMLDKIEYATSFTTQIGVVAGRSIKNIVRNPQTSILTVATSVFFAVIISAIFWQLDENPVSGFSDRSGVLFFLVMNQLFMNMSAVEVFIHERSIFMHENISGFYRVSVYFLVKIFCDMLPLRLVPVVITALIVYFAVGLKLTVAAFFQFMLALACVSMTASSLCFLISSTIRVFAVAQLCLALCYVLMMLFGGFLINLGSIGVWLNWAKYLSLFKYGLAALYSNEFKGRTFCSSNGTVCQTGETFLDQQEVDYGSDWDFWQNYVALIIYSIILLILTYVQLRRMKKHK